MNIANAFAYNLSFALSFASALALALVLFRWITPFLIKILNIILIN